MPDDRELLMRVLDIVRSAYACPEWLEHGRTAETDETLAALEARLGEEANA